MNFRAFAVGLPGMKLIEGRRFVDERGCFVETWSLESFAALGIPNTFVQDNQSLSRRRGTLRGLHFQRAPFSQAKLIQVLSGGIFDVAVDLRTDSPTFSKSFCIELAAEADTQLFIPRGFAHGFVTLTDETVVAYKVDAYYSPQNEAGIIWNDPDIDVDWPKMDEDFILSERDRKLPRLCNLDSMTI